MKRQRVQQSLITLLIILTTMRPGVLVESDCYRGTDEALLYRDVVLRLVWRSLCCGRHGAMAMVTAAMKPWPLQVRSTLYSASALS